MLRRVITSDTVEDEGHDIMPHYLPDGRIVFSSTRQRQARAIQLDENKPQYAGQDEDDNEPAFVLHVMDDDGTNIHQISFNQSHDLDPAVLPSGRIVFSSTRQRQARAILLDENKPQFAAQNEDGTEPAFVLHVMDADGTNIHQISFNQSHDLDPAVLPNGRIVYTRWEHNIDDNEFDLYSVNPDGTDLQLLYGAYSHATGTVDPTTNQPSIIQFLSPRPMQDGRTLALVRPFSGTSEGGDLVLIDTQNFVDNTVAAAVGSGMPGPAQSRALPTDVRTIEGPSPGGRYRSAQPLFDGSDRLLVSWSQCRLIEDTRIVPCTSDRLSKPDPVEAPPLYGIYVYNVHDNTQVPVVPPKEGFIYTEVVAGSPRVVPPVILDKAAGVDFPPDLLAESVGILNIKSVYDIDGADQAPGGIAAVRNPSNAAYATRPARFVRIEKAVSQPDDDTRDIDDTAFGPNRALGMRDILGYAPVEPDGSVKVKVPANVALAISVLDARGRRLNGVLGSRHTNWLQVVPGETLTCNGCHNPNTNPPRAHGRAGLTTSINSGAPATGSPFPGTNTALFADAGETMAEVRNRVMCGGACKPSVDLAFQDYWPAAPATTPSVDACYSAGPSSVLADAADPSQHVVCMNGLKGTLLPVNPTCTSNWTSLCRITIHYEMHIHPLWGIDRFVDANNDGMPDLDPTTMQPINHKCTTCHQPLNAANMVAVPAGDLDLTDGPSDDEPDQFRAYRELLFADVGQIVNAMGQLEDDCLQFQTDPVTNVTTCVQFRQVPASMSAAGAAASGRFFNKMEGAPGAGQTDHRDFMSPSELRLLSEWLDIGAQYYNDPFVAPAN